MLRYVRRMRLTHYVTSPEIAKAYVDSINAPQNVFVLLQAGGHFGAFTHSEDSLRGMNARVRPRAVSNPDSSNHSVPDELHATADRSIAVCRLVQCFICRNTVRVIEREFTPSAGAIPPVRWSILWADESRRPSACAMLRIDSPSLYRRQRSTTQRL